MQQDNAFCVQVNNLILEVAVSLFVLLTRPIQKHRQICLDI